MRRRRVECREAINIKLMLGNERTIFKDVDLCNHKLSTQIDFILVSQVEFEYVFKDTFFFCSGLFCMRKGDSRKDVTCLNVFSLTLS